MQIEAFQTHIGEMHKAIIQLRDENERLKAENNRLEDENENLRTELNAMSVRVHAIEEQFNKEKGVTIDMLHSAICKAETNMLVEFSREDVGTAHVGFDYLLEVLEVYCNG